MRKIIPLQRDDIATIYPNMLKDFPDNERKPQKMIEGSIESGFMEGYGYYEGEKLLAYALFVCDGDARLFDYLAVTAGMRDQGIGSSFLRELSQKLQHASIVIGEVENPDYCQDPMEREIMEKRIAFYNRNGLRDTGASGLVYGVEYRFIELPVAKEHTANEAQAQMEHFYRIYWPEDEKYYKFVQMHN